jgi:hypothetical protein
MKNDLINPIRLIQKRKLNLTSGSSGSTTNQTTAFNRKQLQSIPAGQSSSWTSRAFVVNHCFCVAGIHFGQTIGQSEIRKQLLKFPCLDLKFRSLILIFEFY